MSQWTSSVFGMYRYYLPQADTRSQTLQITRDTVASVGLIPRYLPFIAENNGIRHLRHALALDERRIKFLPNYCVDPVKNREKKPDARPGNKHRSLSKEYEDMVNEEDHQLTDVLEVWFPGVHAGIVFPFFDNRAL